MFVFTRIQRTPWGRVLRAVREDEDAARALGKNAFSYKLQSLALAATTGALAGFLLALSLKFVVPDEFQPLVTFIGYVVLLLGAWRITGGWRSARSSCGRRRRSRRCCSSSSASC